jgi:Flp pilus assembly protein TadD
LGRIILFTLLLSACARTPQSPSQPGANLAETALRGGSPQVALQLANDVLAREPNNVQVLRVQGDALTALGRLGEAEASFRRLLQLDPASVPARVGLGRCLLARDPAGAEPLFLEASKKDPHNPVALNDLGIARDLQRHHAEAQAAYRQALAADPQMSAAQVNLALSLAMSEQTGEAVNLLRPMAQERGAPQKLRQNLAAALAMGGDRKEAEHILAADLTPSEIEQALNAYAAARKLGKPEQDSEADPRYRDRLYSIDGLVYLLPNAMR